MMNIAVVGAGYVGLITGIGFAKLNHQVSIIDLNNDLINNLNNNKAPFYEPDLEENLNDLDLRNKLNFSTSYEESIDKNTDIVFVCVQTPTNIDTGNTDTDYISSVLIKLKELESLNFTLCIKSTINSNLVQNISKNIGLNFERIIFNPEFLREGSAFYDFFNPDRIIIGGSHTEEINKFIKLYQSFDCEIIITDPISSQMIKYLSNTYLAMRLSFVNETYRIVSEFNGNPEEVLYGIGKDKRIGNHYFRPSPGWGGSCFPKDVKEVINSIQEKHELPIISEILKSNQLHMDWFADFIIKKVNDQNFKNIVLIRAPFKENTDDLRDSPSLKIYEKINKNYKNIWILEYEIALPESYQVITSKNELKEDALYVEMFPDISEERKNLLNSIQNLKNSEVLRMWETS